MESTFKVNLTSFDGPLELLWRLVQLNNIDIFDIPISTITADYLQYLQGNTRLPAADLVDFYSLASRLIAIKANMLLSADDESDEEDPRLEIVNELIEFQMLKKLEEQLVYNKQLAGIFDVRRDRLTQVREYYAGLGDETEDESGNEYSPEELAGARESLKNTVAKLINTLRILHVDPLTRQFSFEEMRNRIITNLKRRQFELSKLLDGNNRVSQLLTAVMLLLAFCSENRLKIMQDAPFDTVKIIALE